MPNTKNNNTPVLQLFWFASWRVRGRSTVSQALGTGHGGSISPPKWGLGLGEISRDRVQFLLLLFTM